MPGRLMAEHDLGLKNGTISIAGQEKHNVDSKLPNGVFSNHNVPAQSAQAQPLRSTNGISATPADIGNTLSKPDRLLQDLPPEIAQVTVNFQPLSKLLGRAAQECYNNLIDTITSLAEQPEPVQANGNVNTTNHGPLSAASAHKRVQWLNFANTNRERFIKLLVLLQWSQHVGEVSKIIDLFAWMREQEMHYNNVDDMMGYMKREMHPEKLPNPDLNTALEILSTGQSSQMPDLGYLPLDPLTAPELLKTLKTINTLLHIRLNLHETLPRHFRTFRIASGRATFIVPNEFEVDLSIADEDPNTQFYFIDFRFLFNPSSKIPAGQLLSQLEVRANEVLASSGLSGCYDFFHDFVLTHKINILRRQAIDLSLSNWAGSLRIEMLHRSLVVQYWLDRTGTKSWIEIGVNSGRRKSATGSRKRDEQSQLGVKWARGIKDTEEMSIPESLLADLDMERILQTVITRHIDFILSSIWRNLEIAGCPVVHQTQMEEKLSALHLPLPFSGLSSLDIEPTTGRLVLIPTTEASQRYEKTINELKSPGEQADNLLLSFKVSETSAIIREAATRAGWDILPRVDSKVARVLSQGSIHSAARAIMFNPWTNSSYSIVTLISPLEEPTWWIVKLGSFRAGSSIADDIESVEFLPTENIFLSIGHAFFSNLQKLAISTILFRANMTRLKQLSVRHTLLSEESNELLTQAATPTILIQISDLLRDRTYQDWFNADQILLGMPRSSEFIEGRDIIFHVVKGTMVASGDFLKLLNDWRSPNITFDEHGAFALRIQSTLDSAGSVIDLIASSLSSLCRLRKCLEILGSRNFKCTAATPDRISFTHASSTSSTLLVDTSTELSKIKSNTSVDTIKQSASPEATKSDQKSTPSSNVPLSTEIIFAPGVTTVTFHPTTTNPLNHLRPLFTQLLNRYANPTDAQIISAFSDFTRALPVVLPLIRGVSSLHGQAILHMHTLNSYRLVFSRPSCSFTIRYQFAQGLHDPDIPSWMWFIEQSSPHPADTRNEALSTALTDLWTRDEWAMEKGIVKLGAGVSCTLDTVEKVIKELDATVTSCATGDQDKEYLLLPEDGDEQPTFNGKRETSSAPAAASDHKSTAISLGLYTSPNNEQPRPSSSRAAIPPLPPTTPIPAPASTLGPPPATAAAAAQPMKRVPSQARNPSLQNGPGSVSAGVAKQALMRGKGEENLKGKGGKVVGNGGVGGGGTGVGGGAGAGGGPEIIMLDD